MNTLLRALKVYIDGKISKSVKPQVNSDWNESDESVKSFIKNKPFNTLKANLQIINGSGDFTEFRTSYGISAKCCVVYFGKRLSKKFSCDIKDIKFSDNINYTLNAVFNGEPFTNNGMFRLADDVFDSETLYDLTYGYPPYIVYITDAPIAVIITDECAVIAMFEASESDEIHIEHMSFSIPVEYVKKLDSKYISLPDDLEIERSFSIGKEADDSMGDLSISVGDYSLASGQSSATFGNGNQAYSFSSMAVGYETTAWSDASLALGHRSFAANGSVASMVGGVGTVSRTPGSNVHGAYNVFDNMYPEWSSMRKYYSVGTVVKYEYFLYICIYAHTSSWNNGPTDSKGSQYWSVYDGYDIHVIGNGTDADNRSNAYTLTRGGDAWFSGDVYVHSNSGTNKDEGSKKLMTEDDLAGIVLLPEVTAADNGKVMMVSNGQWTVGNTADITPVPYAEGVKF